MAAHARSWGAIDPALRPPLSSVPPRTMAGAFYSSSVFPKQPPARSQTTYAGQDPSHFASHRLENEDHPKDFLNRFPCIHPVMHLSVTLLKNWNNISNQILQLLSVSYQAPSEPLWWVGQDAQSDDCDRSFGHRPPHSGVPRPEMAGKGAAFSDGINPAPGGWCPPKTTIITAATTTTTTTASPP